jgi:hypothetical protein
MSYVKPDPLVLFNEWEKETGRKLVGLRGETRDQLDTILLTTFSGTGIGRSAFVLAALDMLEEMDADALAAFTQKAYSHEQRLDETVPWGKGM